MTDVMIITVSIAAVLLVLAAVYLVLRFGPWGPKSLKEGDLHAMRVLAELYSKASIELPENALIPEENVWLKVRPYRNAARPALQWGDLPEASVALGFLTEPAEDLNSQLQAFQFRCWSKHGDFVAHWPVMIVAQEWRDWAMLVLQNIGHPTLEARQEIERRQAWLEMVNNLRSLNVASLRGASAWDEDDEFSLLMMLRDDVRPVLAAILDTWASFELQQTFGEQLRSLTGLLELCAKKCLRFLEVVLRTDEVRVHSKLWANLEDADDPIEQDNALNSLTAEVEQMFGEATGDIRGVNRKGNLDKWPEQEALTEAEQQLVDRISQAHKCKDYGLDQQDYEGLLRQYALLHRVIVAAAQASVLARRMSRFAQIGGELFLARELDKTHIIEMLSFVSFAFDLTKQHVEEIADLATKGWQRMRRDSKSSCWSSAGPIDNVRLALSAKADVARSVQEGLHIARDLKSRAEGSSADMLLNELNTEIATYMEDWQEVKRIYNLQSSPLPTSPVPPGESGQICRKTRCIYSYTLRGFSVAPPRSAGGAVGAPHGEV